jgi:hypothetical protein
MSGKHHRVAAFVDSLSKTSESSHHPCYSGYFTCFNVGDYYEAHDVLEHLWLECSDDNHNFYKGLSITNKGIISNVEGESLFLKSSFLQLKGIQYERKTVLVSEALPYHLECGIALKIGFEKQEAELSGLRFVETSAVQRKTIRVSVEGKQSVSLFLNEKKFHADAEIEDISLDGVRLSLSALPAGLQKDDPVRLDIVLELDKRPLILNTKAKVYTKAERKHSFSVVFLFEELQKSELVKYITKRQMAIIREFKGLQNG